MYPPLLASDDVKDFFRCSSVPTTTATAAKPPPATVGAVSTVSSALLMSPSSSQPTSPADLPSMGMASFSEVSSPPRFLLHHSNLEQVGGAIETALVALIIARRQCFARKHNSSHLTQHHYEQRQWVPSIRLPLLSEYRLHRLHPLPPPIFLRQLPTYSSTFLTYDTRQDKQLRKPLIWSLWSSLLHRHRQHP